MKLTGFCLSLSLVLVAVQVQCLPTPQQFDISMFEPFLENPDVIRELGDLVANDIRSKKPSDLVRAGLGVDKNATVHLIDSIPGADIGKNIVAGGIEAVAQRPTIVRALVDASANTSPFMNSVGKLFRRVATLVLTDEE